MIALKILIISLVTLLVLLVVAIGADMYHLFSVSRGPR